MNVVVFASRKGGSGKSTLTAHLAAHAHKPSRSCLLVDADPQGSLTLWHKLRNAEALPLKAAARGVADVIKAAKRAGFDWVLVDTPPTMTASVADAMRMATLVVVPCRPSVFDIEAVKETVAFARKMRKPYAVVINAAPPRRQDVELPMVTYARENSGSSSAFRCGAARSRNGRISRWLWPKARGPGNTQAIRLRRTKWRGCGSRSKNRSRRSRARSTARPCIAPRLKKTQLP